MPRGKADRRQEPSSKGIVGKHDCRQSSPQRFLGGRVHGGQADRSSYQPGVSAPQRRQQLHGDATERRHRERGDREGSWSRQPRGRPGHQLGETPRAEQRERQPEAYRPLRGKTADVSAPGPPAAHGRAKDERHAGRHGERHDRRRALDRPPSCKPHKRIQAQAVKCGEGRPDPFPWTGRPPRLVETAGSSPPRRSRGWTSRTTRLWRWSRRPQLGGSRAAGPPSYRWSRRRPGPSSLARSAS